MNSLSSFSKFVLKIFIVKAVHLSTHIIIQMHLLKPACRTPTGLRGKCRATSTQNNQHESIYNCLCAHVLLPGFSRHVSLLLHVGGVWLLHGSWTLKHLSLNNLHPLSLLNNSETLLIFCEIMVVILRWERSGVGLWGSDWFGASHCPQR